MQQGLAALGLSALAATRGGVQVMGEGIPWQEQVGPVQDSLGFALGIQMKEEGRSLGRPCTDAQCWKALLS